MSQEITNPPRPLTDPELAKYGFPFPVFNDDTEYEEPLCRNCRFWKENKDEHFGTCSNEKFVEVSDRNNGDELLYYKHDSTHKFFTGADFGCIHWKPKDV